MVTDLLSDPLSLGLLLLLGGWAAADGTSVGQIMVSRPLLAATLAGWIVGEPLAGATVGVILESFHLAVLPVGAARYPEGGPPAVVSGAVYAASAHLPGNLLLAVLFALAWEWVSGAGVRYLRQANVYLLSARPEAGVDTLQARHLLAILMDAGRGMLLVAVGLLILIALMAAARPSWPLSQQLPLLTLTAALVGQLASTTRLFSGRARLFLAGALGGLLFAALRA